MSWFLILRVDLYKKLPMIDAAFPVKANNKTFGFRGSSSCFRKSFSVQTAMASMVFDFPAPERISNLNYVENK